jgi:hypothetical protein
MAQSTTVITVRQENRELTVRQENRTFYPANKTGAGAGKQSTSTINVISAGYWNDSAKWDDNQPWKDA